MDAEPAHRDPCVDLREAVDLIQRTIIHVANEAEITGRDLNALYRRFGLGLNGNILSSAEVSEVLEHRLKRYLSLVDRNLMTDLFTRIRRYLLYTHLKTGSDIKDVWNVIARGREELRQLDNRNGPHNYSELSIATLIKMSIILAWMRLCGSVHDDFTSSRQVAREEWEYARTILYIENIVPSCRVLYGELEDKELIMATLFDRIEHRIRIYGPSIFLVEILYEYRKTFVSRRQVFGPAQLSVRKFLLMLSIKLATADVARPDRANRPSSELKSVIHKMSNALLNLVSVRDDSPFRFMFVGDPIEYFQRVVIQDTLYKDFQYVPQAMLILLENILRPHERKVLEEMNLTLVELVTISRAIIEEALRQLGSPEGPTMRIAAEDIIETLQGGGTPSEKVHTYINKMRSNRPLNEHFNNPMDMLHVNSDSEWLIPETPGGDTYFVPLPSIQCFGLYDKVLGQLGNNGGFLDVGLDFEAFVRSYIGQQVSTTVYTGKFVYQGQVFETDGALVIGNHVILLECKTKPIRRDSRSGLIAQLLIDFANSYIYSQLQAYRCEAAFREGNLLALYPADSRDSDVLGGRCTPSVVLSLPENPLFTRITCTPTSYGSFNEPILCSNILEAVAMYDFRTTVPNLERSFDDLADTKSKLLRVWEDLKQYYTTSEDQSHFIKDITFYSHFMPFALLYILLDRNVSQRQPLERLRSYSHSQAQSYDVLSIMDMINDNPDQIFGRILRKQTNGPIIL